MTDRVTAVLNGERRALARALTAIENGGAGVADLLVQLYPHTGRAHIIGVTGAPGTGKSTLVTALAQAYRQREQTVGVLAVDPTSPFTGGAIMGDRIRMTDLSGDPGVFIRSMATRGKLGGLARATLDAARVLDAAGMDVILIETVGAGQSEVDIARTAQTTLVVEAPGLGDDIQTIKAGILEIADVLVVNKADRPGADNTVRALQAMLELGHPTRRQYSGHHGAVTQQNENAANGSDDDTEFWLPPVIKTVASVGDGIAELIDAIDTHHAFLAADDRRAQLERQQIALELDQRLRETLLERVFSQLPDAALAAVIEQVQARRLTPEQAVDEILANTDL